MIILTIIILIIILQLLIRVFLKERKLIYALYIISMMLILFFGMAVFSSLYFIKDSSFIYSISRVLFLPQRGPLRSMLPATMALSRLTLIRLLNLFSILFVSLCPFFSQVYQEKQLKRSGILYMFLFQAVHYMVFDPAVHKWFYYAVYPDKMAYSSIQLLKSSVHSVSVMVNVAIMLYGIISLILYLIRTPQFRETFSVSIMVTVLYGLSMLSYAFVFLWAPDYLIHINKLSNTIRYLSIPHSFRFIPYGMIAYIEAACMLLVIVSLFTQGYMIKQITDSRNQIERTIKTASVISSSFSHYMKNEILEIQSELDLLSEIGYDNPQAVEATASRIRAECERVSDRLHVMNESTRRISLLLTECDLKELLEPILENLGPKLTDIRVTQELEATKIRADARSFSDVLHNLIQNSAEALMNDTENKQKEIRILSVVRSGCIKITIEDNGPGIPKKDQQIIFEPYISSKPLKTNWGLGLYVCKRVVSAHDGSIEMSSREGKGTAVVITLPNPPSFVAALKGRRENG